MQIEVKIDQQQAEPVVQVIVPEMTDEVAALVKQLSHLGSASSDDGALGTAQRANASPPETRIIGYRDSVVTLLDLDAINRVFASNQRVFAQTDDELYQLRMRLYEFEEIVSSTQFVRISKSEIINLRNVKGFDLSLVGTVCVQFKNGEKTFVSRRYVARIKEVLGV